MLFCSIVYRKLSSLLIYAFCGSAPPKKMKQEMQLVSGGSQFPAFENLVFFVSVCGVS